MANNGLFSPIGSRVGAAGNTRKRGVREPSSNEFLFGAGTSMKRRRTESPRGYLSVSANPLGGFRDSFNSDLLRTDINPPQRVVNQKQTYTRFLHRASPTEYVSDTISKGEIGFLLRDFEDKSSTPGELTARENMIKVPAPDGMLVSVNQNPVLILNAPTWNYRMFTYQQRLFKSNPEAFYDLTPQDLMKNWSVEGAMIAETMMSGAESETSGGFGARGQWLGGNGMKVGTFNIRGEEMISQQFGDQVIEGAALYMIIKKFDVPPGGYDFKLQQGLAPPPMSRHATSLQLESALRGIQGVVSDSKNAKFNPYMMALFAHPNHAEPPLAYRRYVDEYGVERYDAKVIYLGRVLFAPANAVYKPPSRDGSHIRPLLDVNQGSRLEPMKVIMNPGGWNPLG